MLCATAVRVHIITFHSTTNYREFLSSEGIHMNFPDHLSYVDSAASVDTPLPRSPDWAWEARCSLYSLNQSRLPGLGWGWGSHPYMNNTGLK